MINQGKYNNDLDVWGLTHNYYHEHLNNAYEHIDIINSTTVTESTGDNVPVIKAGTCFMLYSSASADITSQAAGNNCFPPSTTVNYPNHYAIFEPNDVTTTNSTLGISSTDRFTYTISLNNTAITYFLLCNNVDDVSSTSIGLGLYTISSSTQVTLAFDYLKGGFYSTNGERFLAKFHYLSTTLGLEINEIYRKDIRYNITSQTSSYTAQSYDDIILLNSSIGEMPDNSDSRYLGVVNTFKNINNTSTAIIYGDLTDSTSVNILPMAAMTFFGGSTSWHIISQFSSNVITSTNITLTNYYETGFLLNELGGSSVADWSNVLLGDSSTSNSDITHNLGCNINQLSIKLLISTSSTFTGSFELNPMSRSNGTPSGYTVFQVSTNSIRIHTGSEGIRFISTSGLDVLLTNQSYYYHVSVIKQI